MLDFTSPFLFYSVSAQCQSTIKAKRKQNYDRKTKERGLESVCACVCVWGGGVGGGGVALFPCYIHLLQSCQSTRWIYTGLYSDIKVHNKPLKI